VVCGLLLVIPILAVLPTSCEPDTGFACGTPQRHDDTVIQTCTRNLEVCVCATASCAKRDIPGPVGAGGAAADSAELCDSGYRYAEAPFADSAWADRCVPREHVEQFPLVPTSANPGPLCPTLPFPPSAHGGSGGSAPGPSGGASGDSANNAGAGGA
jgi:hypothetical protein